MRTDVPWYETIGPTYIAEAFHAARAADPKATLVLNEFGFETDAEFDTAAERRAKALKVIDALQADDVPLDAFGVQGHLSAASFREAFDAARTGASCRAGRPRPRHPHHRARRARRRPAGGRRRSATRRSPRRRSATSTSRSPSRRCKSVMTFGLSDRYTWLQEDYPREDGAPRRPLPFDEELRAKPMRRALARELDDADRRRMLWRLRRGR